MKKKIVKVSFTFSEAPNFKPCSFATLAEADVFLAKIRRPETGYYKTDFTIIFEDGNDYRGRYDVGDDQGGIARHIRGIYEGLKDPRHISHGLLPQWEKLLAEYEF